MLGLAELSHLNNNWPNNKNNPKTPLPIPQNGEFIVVFYPEGKQKYYKGRYGHFVTSRSDTTGYVTYEEAKAESERMEKMVSFDTKVAVDRR